MNHSNPVITADVPVLSMRAARDPQQRDAFAQALYASLSEHGFVRIAEHGISPDRLARAYQQLVDLFSLTSTQKQAYMVGRGGERAYTAFGVERAADSEQPDLKEFWHIGPELAADNRYANIYAPNIWPQELPGFEPFFKEFYQQMLALANEILITLGEAMELPADYFPGLVDSGNSVLRLIHYPPVAGMNTHRQMRAAAHADINLLTLLVGASDAGLQLLDRSGRWCDVPSLDGEIIVDSGDMMALITGGVIPATVHRVINPDNQQQARYSMPFFVHPHSDAMLECLPQFSSLGGSPTRAITAGDFLAERLAENGF